MWAETAGNEQAPEPPPSVPADTNDLQADTQPEVGHIGARFGSPAMRRRMRAEAGSPEPPPPMPEQDPSDERPIEGVDAPERSPADSGAEIGAKAGVGFGFGGAVAEDHTGALAADRAPSLVRPYAWTGGRTAASYDLRLETLVSAHPGAALATPASTAEYRRIVEVCAMPTSVAEVAVALSVPLGVVRVLLGDLIAMRIVTVHDNGGAAGGASEMALLERVLAGLHRL
jgi:hypothetical protein